MIIGLTSLWKAPLDLLPDIDPPFLAVITIFPGSSPQETMQLVTEPVEEQLSTTGGLTGLSSLSQENASMVLMKFQWGANLDSLRDEVSSRLDLITLPEEVKRPVILKFDPTMLPVIQVDVGAPGSLTGLTDWLDSFVKPRLEKIEGVAAVEIHGGVKEDIFVRLTPELVNRYQLSLEQIGNILRGSLLDLPAGVAALDQKQARLRFLGRPESLTELDDLVVGFRVNRDLLQKMIGENIDLDLQDIVSQSIPIRAGNDIPMKTIYIKDIALGVHIDERNNNLVIALNEDLLAGWGFDVSQLVYLFPPSWKPKSVQEGIVLPIPPQEVLDWQAIGNTPLMQIPDFSACLEQLQQEAEKGAAGITSQLEKLLAEMASSMMMLPAGEGNIETGLLQEDLPFSPVTLGSIADIAMDKHNPSHITKVNGNPGIRLVIQKEGEANTVAVSRRVRQSLDELAESSQARQWEAAFMVTYDQAEDIENALGDLAWSLLGGSFLAIIVLLIFLRSWRTVAIIGISIPIAIITAFSLLFFSNLTINLMTLGALALAAGMLVDNAIIVSENIYRHYQMGHGPFEAASRGAKEVGGAVLASTLTTISVFIPVLFISGLARELFRDFAIIVSSALLASLIVAITLIPLLASRFLRHRGQVEKLMPMPMGKKTYRRLLKIITGKPWAALVTGTAFILLGLFLYPLLGTNLFPAPEESSLNIDLSLPPGATLAQTDKHVQEIESILEKMPSVDHYITRIGESRFFGLPMAGGASNEARITVHLTSRNNEGTGPVMDEIREEAAHLTEEVEMAFSRMSLLDAAGLETKLELLVEGCELSVVGEITGELVQKLNQIDQVSEAVSLLEETRPEVHVRLIQSLGLKKGVTTFQAAMMVRQALEGIEVARLETKRGVYNLILSYDKEKMNSIDELQKTGFYTPGGSYLQLSEVASFDQGYGPASIPRENQRIVGLVNAQYRGNLGDVTREVMEAVGEMNLPPEYTVSTAGTASLMEEVFEELELLLIMAALLVYLIMAAQFESLLHPLIIILSLPLAFSGSVFALLLTGNSISVPALIGAVVLAGILVNDGIIMIDLINQKRRLHGLSLQEAVIQGAGARMRPILMTTITTILGLLPLALGLGQGSQLQAPMAIVIIGGQVTGTALLLFILPAGYKLISKET